MRKHDFTRSESENWRTSRDEVNGEDGEVGGWRLAGALACALQRDSDRWCPPSPGVPCSHLTLLPPQCILSCVWVMVSIAGQSRYNSKRLIFKKLVLS